MQSGAWDPRVCRVVGEWLYVCVVVVTFVSLMVHIYSIGYMHDDPGYHRFFSYISLFTFAMLSLVMANNFLQLFFGWEAVGVMSYLLIGFWFTKESAIKANFKAFIIKLDDIPKYRAIAIADSAFDTLWFPGMGKLKPSIKSPSSRNWTSKVELLSL